MLKTVFECIKLYLKLFFKFSAAYDHVTWHTRTIEAKKSTQNYFNKKSKHHNFIKTLLTFFDYLYTYQENLEQA